MGEDINKLIDEANQYFYKNDYDHAFRLYEKILEIDPLNLLSLQKLARIELARGDRLKAAEYLQRSLKIDPIDVNTLNDLGNIYFELKDYQKAMDFYGRAIALNPDYYWAYFNFGLTLRHNLPGSKEVLEKAKDWFEKALAINPDYYPALNELGLYYMEKEELTKAEECFLKAIEISPAYKYPYFNLALIAKKRNDKHKAKRYLRKAIEYDPAYTSALNNLGIIYYEEEKYKVAAYYFTKALENDPNYLFSLYNMGLIFANLGEYRKAYQMFDKSLGVEPFYENALQEKEKLEKDFSLELTKDKELEEKDLQSISYLAFLEEELKHEQADKGDEVNKATKEEKILVFTEPKYFCEKFGRNITSLAKAGKLFPVLGREKEIQAVLEVLLKLKKNNPLIIGQAGVGKTAIVEGIAQKIVAGQVPDFFLKKEIIEINMGMLVAGTQFRGDFEKRLAQIIEEVSQNESLIIFIDEIHTVLGAGETIEGSLDAANILKPALARGDLHCIGSTTSEEYQKYFIKDQAFMRRFYPIHIAELSAEATKAILMNLKPQLEKHYKLIIKDELLDLIIELAAEEIRNRVFPDKAIDILENSCARAVLSGKKEIDEYIIKTIIAEYSGIKYLETDQAETVKLLQLENFLKSRILGQDEAIEKVTKIIRLMKQKLDLKPEQPDGVFLFLGPSGVGKTYLAQQLALFLFGSEEKFLSLNMAEFSEAHSVSKLIGSPPGYVGHEDVPLFSRTILENPSSLLLLDEIEKAHPDVLKLFLQIFDEGKISDTKNRQIYFANITIIMTSNAGFMQDQTIGFGENKNASQLDLNRYFPVEFVNRIDEIIVFKNIERLTAKKILEQLLITKAQKTFRKKGIEVEFDPLFLDYILEQGYSTKFGVRNLERTFEKEVLAEIANYLYLKPQAKKIFISRHSSPQTVH